MTDCICFEEMRIKDIVNLVTFELPNKERERGRMFWRGTMVANDKKVKQLHILYTGMIWGLGMDRKCQHKRNRADI